MVHDVRAAAAAMKSRRIFDPAGIFGGGGAGTVSFGCVWSSCVVHRELLPYLMLPMFSSSITSGVCDTWS